MHEFDEDTRLGEVAPGTYTGFITDRWNIGTVPNGGYVLAIGMAALRRVLPQPDPLSVTAHYLGPCAPGPVTVLVETAKAGRRYATATTRLLQGESERVRILGTYGTLGESDEPAHVTGAPPPLPPRDGATVVSHAGDAPSFVHRFEIRSQNHPFMPGQSAAQPEVSGWLRFADGRRPDVHTLGLVADAFPPPAFHVLDPGWVPTLELTVHVRARPASQWLRCAFRTRFIFGGLLEEDGEIWDEAGTLVALSRQLAAVPRRA